MSVSGGTISSTFTYDPDGNQTSGLGRTIAYTSYNMPSSITQGARTISFLDDTEHQRFKQIAPEGTTLYIAAFGVLEEVFDPGTSSVKWTDYLSAGSAKVGMRVLQAASETLTMRYFHTDNLGSISVISDESGAVQERLAYDAWGKRRFANGTDDPSGSITSQATRGFTGEEELSVSGLVHLNGRVYDPLLARFTSADTMTESPFSTQGWNRYSYVGNDPLAYTDPSGHCFLGCFWQHVGHFFSGLGRDITHFFRTNAIARSILQIGATFVLNVVLPGLGFAAGTALTVASAAVGAIIATGLSGGNLSQTLKAGLIAGATAFAFYEVGDLTGHTPSFGSPAYAENIAGHAAVGCLSTTASGGKCGSGALSAAVGSALSPLTNTVFPEAESDFGQRIGGTILEATAGGLASVAGGGKFENGAVTGAFGYLFNNEAGKFAGHVAGFVAGAILGGGPEDPLLETPMSLLGGMVGDWLTGPDTPDGLADLANFRSELGLESGQGTLARLDVDGQSFYGISAHGQSIDLTVNPISATHAEADSFQQAADAGISGGSATLYVDRALCLACGQNGAVRSMARQLGITDLRIVTPR